jgi:hypothetical protein
MLETLNVSPLIKNQLKINIFVIQIPTAACKAQSEIKQWK